MIPTFPLDFSLLNIICLSCSCRGNFSTLLKSSQFCWVYYFRFAVIAFKTCLHCYNLRGVSVFSEKSAVRLLLQLSIYILCYIYLSVLIMLRGFSFLILFIVVLGEGCYAQTCLPQCGDIISMSMLMISMPLTWCLFHLC